MLKRRRIIVLAILAALAIGLAAVQLRHPDGGQERRALAIAVSFDPSSAPIFVADAKGFFRDEGINASLLMHMTGKAALGTMLKGKAQFATIADTVLMFAGMDGLPIRCVTVIAESTRHHRVIALRSSGIVRGEDLRGKRIGVPARTTGEFFLYTFLLFRGIRFSEVTLVDLQPEQMLAALEQGRVDAVAAWNPTAGRLTQALTARAIEFSDENYLMSWNLVVPGALTTADPAVIRKVLAAMRKAQRFMEQQPEAAVSITSRYSGTEPDLLRREWQSYRFGLRLGESLLIDLEDQARWAVKFYYPRRAIPDFTCYLYGDGLRAVDPSAVGIRDERVP